MIAHSAADSTPIRLLPESRNRKRAMSHKAATKPTGPYDHSTATADGHKIDVHQFGPLAGAWLILEGDDHSLAVVSTGTGRAAQNYVQYRDGSGPSGLPRVALSVEPGGEVLVQVVVPGHRPESERVRHIPLSALDEFARSYNPAPEPQ